MPRHYSFWVTELLEAQKLAPAPAVGFSAPETLLACRAFGPVPVVYRLPLQQSVSAQFLWFPLNTPRVGKGYDSRCNLLLNLLVYGQLGSVFIHTAIPAPAQYLVLSQLVVGCEITAGISESARTINGSVGISKYTIAPPVSSDYNIRLAILLNGALHLFDNPSELSFHFSFLIWVHLPVMVRCLRPTTSDTLGSRCWRGRKG
jgi:hypothetical protein